jgi:hypothetical protein
MTIALTHARPATAAAARAAARDTSSVHGASDEALIKRIASGDQLAMRTVYARHRIPLYRWLLRIVRNETVAEDLLSDVFLDVWRWAASFEGRASVSTWLFAIARYKALSARRARPDAGIGLSPVRTCCRISGQQCANSGLPLQLCAHSHIDRERLRRRNHAGIGQHIRYRNGDRRLRIEESAKGREFAIEHVVYDSVDLPLLGELV